MLSLTFSPSLTPPLRSSLLVTMCGIKEAPWFAYKLIILTDRRLRLFLREGSQRRNHTVFSQQQCCCWCCFGSLHDFHFRKIFFIVRLCFLGDKWICVSKSEKCFVKFSHIHLSSATRLSCWKLIIFGSDIASLNSTDLLHYFCLWSRHKSSIPQYVYFILFKKLSYDTFTLYYGFTCSFS